MKDASVTQLLGDAQNNPEAARALVPLVYQELRRMAARRLGALKPGHTLQPTALVHEVYAELLGKQSSQWQNRAHFFGAAARAMRELLVDHARKKYAHKRGGQATRVNEVDDLPDGLQMPKEDMLALDQALAKLELEHPRAAQVVHLNYFVGLTHEEIAELLEITPRTVERDWRLARAWLHQALETQS